jgi:membrane protein DedA with SNARE-associated domain
MHAAPIILAAIYHHQPLAYAILCVAMLLEGGEISLPLFGALSRTGAVNLSVVVMVGVGAAIGYDILFWWLGRHVLKKSIKKIFFINIGRIESALEQMRSSAGLFIFFSKFAYGLNRITLAATGYLNIRLKKMLRYSIPAATLWAISLISLGYIFADRAKFFRKRIEHLGVFVLAALVIVVVFELYIKHVIARHLITPDNADDDRADN